MVGLAGVCVLATVMDTTAGFTVNDAGGATTMTGAPQSPPIVAWNLLNDVVAEHTWATCPVSVNVNTIPGENPAAVVENTNKLPPATGITAFGLMPCQATLTISAGTVSV